MSLVAGTTTSSELEHVRWLIEETLRILDRSQNSGPTIDDVTRELSLLARRLRLLEEVWSS